MLQKLVTFAACLVMASALRVEKCNSKHKPLFLSQKDGSLGGLEGKANKFGQVEKDLELDIANMGMMLA